MDPMGNIKIVRPSPTSQAISSQAGAAAGEETSVAERGARAAAVSSQSGGGGQRGGATRPSSPWEFHTRPGCVTNSLLLKNGHRNSGFSHIFPLKMVIFHSYVNVYQRVMR